MVSLMQTAIDYRKQITDNLDKVPEEKLSDLAQIVEVFTGRHEEDEELVELDARWAEYEETGQAVSHDDVVKWLRSWGTDSELPCPTIK